MGHVIETETKTTHQMGIVKSQKTPSHPGVQNFARPSVRPGGGFNVRPRVLFNVRPRLFSMSVRPFLL